MFTLLLFTYKACLDYLFNTFPFFYGASLVFKPACSKNGCANFGKSGMRVIIKFEVNLLSPNLLEFKSFTFSLFCNCPEIFLLHRHFLFSVNWMKNVFLIQSHFDNNYRPQPKFAKVMFSQVFVCPQGEGSLSRGVSVQGVSIWGVSVQGVSVHSGISIQWGICLGVLCGCLCLICLCLGGLCPGKGSLSREGVSVQGRGLCLGRGSLSVQGVSVHSGISIQWGICLGVLCGCLCLICLCLGGLCLGRGLCPGVSVPGGSLSRGSLSSGISVQGVSVREDPHPSTVTCGRYASHWNAFLF